MSEPDYNNYISSKMLEAKQKTQKYKHMRIQDRNCKVTVKRVSRLKRSSDCAVNGVWNNYHLTDSVLNS